MIEVQSILHEGLWLDRRQYATILHSIVLVQCAVRTRFAKKKHQSLHRENKRFTSARTIQNIWRVSVARVVYSEDCAARKDPNLFQKCQSPFQVSSMEATFCISDEDSVSFSCYCDYVLAINDVINNQRCYRGYYRGRKRYKAKQ